MVSFQKTQKTFCSVYAKLLQINTLQFPVVLWREDFFVSDGCYSHPQKFYSYSTFDLSGILCIYQANFNLQFIAKYHCDTFVILNFCALLDGLSCCCKSQLEKSYVLLKISFEIESERYL